VVAIEARLLARARPYLSAFGTAGAEKTRQLGFGESYGGPDTVSTATPARVRPASVCLPSAMPARALRTILRALAGVDARLIRAHFAAASVRKLHVGCGGHPLAGWLNSDLDPRRWSTLRLDAARRFPLDDACLDYVYSEHMIEHLTLPQGRRFLTECRRVLKPGGRIRTATPDLAFLLDLLRPDKSALQQQYVRWAAATFLPGVQGADASAVVNNFFRDWGHRFIYDEPTLRRELAAAGFAGIVRRALNASDDPNLRGLENESRLPAGFLALETMVLEAERPQHDPALGRGAAAPPSLP
jgi:predicted SAM-dependent methyltransferase